MNFCTSCGAPAEGDGRFCGSCGAPLTGSTAPSGSRTGEHATTPKPAPATTDLGEAIRSNPAPAIRAGTVAVLVITALIKPWELTSVGLWGATESNSAAGNGWALVTLLLVLAAAAVGFFVENLKGLGLPISPRALQALLVMPFLVTALISMMRTLAEDTAMGPAVAIGVVASVLAVQVAAPPGESAVWRVAAIAGLGAGAVLTLWQLRVIVDLGQIDGLLAILLLVTVGWIPLLAIWFILGLRDHKPAEWAALVVFGAGLLVAMVLVSGGADPGLTLMVGGATAAVAPGMSTLMATSEDPAARWLQWAAGVMVLWMVGAAVMCVIGLLGAVKAAEFGVGAGGLVLLGLWGAASAIVAGLARKHLIEEPAKGRKIAVTFAAVSVPLYLISLAATDAEMSDPATLMAGFAVPVVVILMLALPHSVNERYGKFLPTSDAGPLVD